MKGLTKILKTVDQIQAEMPQTESYQLYYRNMIELLRIQADIEMFKLARRK